jgi:hypothetical protein
MARTSGAGATRIGGGGGPYKALPQALILVKAIPVGPSPNVQLVFVVVFRHFFLQPFSLGGTSICTCASRWNRHYEPSSVAHNELPRDEIIKQIRFLGE